MPLGFERINERTQRPNAHINFIRPLPGPTSDTAEQILNRVAAVCYPFMKSNMILVQALEEFPFNTEFVGRNFNAGEVIQLVLRDRSGRWLPQRMVEMVMVHELAHCKQMNHSQAFWKVRNEYAGDLKALWAKGYTGEGLWGRGRELTTGAVQMDEDDVADIPEHLCGGTYGRRSKKRKRGGKDKPTMSYAERKQRRILKKFGAGGQSLGADEDTKVKLEGGVPKKGKPRVAGSARGRELRAAAALARFDTPKTESPAIKRESISSDSETEDEVDREDPAVDVDGKEMFDDQGRALVKICEDEDDRDENAMNELEELQGFTSRKKHSTQAASLQKSSTAPPKNTISNSNPKKSSSTKDLSKSSSSAPSIAKSHSGNNQPPKGASGSKVSTQPTVPFSLRTGPCPLCSLENGSSALTCAACSNVLNPALVPNHWRCNSATCKGNEYINSGDAGACGLCGTLRSAS